MNRSIVTKGYNNILDLTKSGKLFLLPKTGLNYLSAYLKLPFCVPKPIQIQIEPSAACNLKCAMCNLDKSNESEKFLTPEKLKKIIKDLRPIKSINFTGMGESLLNPFFPQLIEISTSHKIETSFITNAQLLSPKLIEEILTHDLSSISISIESADPLTYAQIRVGGQLETLKRNLRYLTQYCKRKHSSTRVLFNVVLLKTNLDDLKHIFKIIDLAYELNIGEISFQNPHDLRKEGTYDYYTKNKQSLLTKFKDIDKYAANRGIKVSLPQVEIKSGSCYYPWVYPQITASGELLPCCIIPQFGPYRQIIKNFSFGNVADENFVRVWNGNKSGNFRKALNRDRINYCLNCSKNKGVL